MQVRNLLHSARWKYSAKSRHFGTIAQLCRAICSELRHVSTIGKNLLNSNTSSTCPHNMVNSGLLMRSVGEFGHPCKFQRVSHLCSVTAWHSSSGRQPNFAASNTGRHLYSAGRPLRWALAHILVTAKLRQKWWRNNSRCRHYKSATNENVKVGSR